MNLQFDFEDDLACLGIVAETVQFRLRFESLKGGKKLVNKVTGR